MKTIAESNGTFYMGKNLKNDLGEEYLLENQIRKRKQEDEAKKAAELYMQAQKNKQAEIDAKLEKLEMLPMGSRVILSAHPVNPYRKVVEGNLVVDYQGQFFNPDTGEMDKMETFVGCAEVIEAGPECKYLKPGDDVYYDTRTVHPVPFMSLGYVVTHEQGILCVINESLKERFNMY